MSLVNGLIPPATPGDLSITGNSKNDLSSHDDMRTQDDTRTRDVGQSPRFVMPVNSSATHQIPTDKPPRSVNTAWSVLTSSSPGFVLRQDDAEHSAKSVSDSSDKSRIRSESLPSSLTTSMGKSPQSVPALNLKMLPPADEGREKTSASSAVSPTKFKSPRGSARVHISDTRAISTSAPSTPRKSPRHAEHYKPSSVRNRIETSPQKSIKSPIKNVMNADLQTRSSPRGEDSELVMLGDEVSRLWITKLRKNHETPRASDINTLSRTDVVLSLQDASPELLSRLQMKNDQIITHAALIKDLYLPEFRRSGAGKTLETMKKVVMESYDGYSLGQIELADKSREDPDFKRRLLLNMAEPASAVIEIAFGSKNKKFSDSKLPQELIKLWKSLDRELCTWTTDRTARVNLAFDLFMTRMMLPVISGDPDEAALGIPNYFFEAVKLACTKVWGDFIDHLISSVDGERQGITTASSGGGSVSTTPQGNG